ncbi:MAG: RNA polymerase sigma-70 factor [Marinifilaceae bacterium]|jgi:RNA polymerase sigma-70 factor (ECF subfamily)|nr:RNA polymerase sigma-70 factor [Marinifilaceae bacterium]
MKSSSANQYNKLTTNSKSSFKSIFNEFYKPLCLFGFRFCSSHEFIVEDCVQEVLFKCWNEGWHSQKISNLKSYLYTAVKNRIFTELRRHKLEDNYSSSLDPEQEFSQSFENVMIEEEVKLQLLESVNQLPDQCRKIFNLLIQGASYNDVAEALDISVNTVKSQRKRAIDILKDKINDGELLFLLI